MENSKCFSYKINPTHFLSARQWKLCQKLLNNHRQICLSFIDLNYLLKACQKERNKSFPLSFLSKKEQKKYLSFNFDKRKLEWLGGRVAAKISCSELILGPQTPVDWHAWEVTPNPAGRPYILPNLPNIGPPPDISISHSGNLACGCASQKLTCGIDLQKITSTTIKVKKRFASSKEQSILKKSMSACDQSTALTLLWAAKESLRKAFVCDPLLGFTDLQLIDLIPYDNSTYGAFFSCTRFPDAPMMQCFLVKHHEYAFALTLISSLHNPNIV